jgi:hypothetical protein
LLRNCRTPVSQEALLIELAATETSWKPMRLPVTVLIVLFVGKISTRMYGDPEQSLLPCRLQV